jgi:hypothetical protein
MPELPFSEYTANYDTERFNSSKVLESIGTRKLLVVPQDYDLVSQDPEFTKQMKGFCKIDEDLRSGDVLTIDDERYVASVTQYKMGTEPYKLVILHKK